MKTSEAIDYLFKVINSILFRAVILLYAIIIVIHNPNYFHFSIYLLVCIIYIFLFSNIRKYPLFRLINDYLLITVILYYKNPDLGFNYLFIYLPVINSINFTGKKKSLLLYILPFICYLFLNGIFWNEFSLIAFVKQLWFLGPLIILAFINFYTSLRSRGQILKDSLNDIVNDFYLDIDLMKKPYKIYDKFISTIDNYFGLQTIQTIVCFRIINKNKLSIVNSSTFLWDINFTGNDFFLSNLLEKKVIWNTKIDSLGIEFNYNLSVYIPTNNSDFLFCFICDRKIPENHVFTKFEKLLEPSLFRIANVLNNEKSILEIKNSEFKKLSKKIHYVNRANKTMHFIRNRLGPYSNLIEMLSDFKLESSEDNQFFLNIIFKENDRARIELKNITTRANNMLDNKNPFIYNELERTSIEKLFSKLRNNIQLFFPENDIEVEIDNINIKKYVNLNEEGFDIFLSDWLNNMKKYNNNLVNFKFNIIKNKLSIIFINNFKGNSSDIRKMISDLMSNDRTEIVKRTTYGLAIIKSTLNDMNINFHLECLDNDKLIKFQLNLDLV